MRSLDREAVIKGTTAYGRLVMVPYGERLTRFWEVHSPLSPAFRERRPRNEGRFVGAKRALKQRQVWAIRFRLDQHRRLRDRAASARAQTPSQALKPAPKAPPMNRNMPSDMGRGNGVHWMGVEEIAMLMYPSMTVLDLIGPQAMFGSMMGAKVRLVGETLEPVTSDAGVTIVPHATFETCPRDLTVLFAPGGTEGTIAAAKDQATLAFMRDCGARARYVTSVCSGSLILGAAGYLKGYKATSHRSVRDVLAGFGAISTNARIVRDRNRITGAGVTPGLDFGLTMVAELLDRTYAECTQLMTEYDTDPPFHAGSIKTAPAEAKVPMMELVAEFRKEAKALVMSRKEPGPA